MLISAKVSVSFNDTVVAESDQVRVMYELGHAPVYYFPRSALKPGFFETVADHHTFCPYKGVASYMTLRVGDRSVPNGAWIYESPYPQQAGLADHVAFYWGKMDEWREDGERVSGPREIPGRIDTTNQLKAAFPTGVCDWTKAAVGRQRTVPWLTYQNAVGAEVRGGVPLGQPPQSIPFRL